jgi:hypothetical protein
MNHARGQHGNLRIDRERARQVAQQLYRSFLPGGQGVFGEWKASQNVMPSDMEVGSRDHLLFLTFTVSVNRQRDALDLWRRASAAWSDPETHYLFEPKLVCSSAPQKVDNDLKRLGISKKTQIDAAAWRKIAQTLVGQWGGEVASLLAACAYDARSLLAKLESEGQWIAGKFRPSFPLLRGPKIGPLWIRILRDKAGVELKGLAGVPIPVDVHVLRATLCSGSITGTFKGRSSIAFEVVRRVWNDATEGITRIDGSPMVALDVDEALWTLSRLGCSQRGNGPLKPCPTDCPLGGCATGAIRIDGNTCDVDL